jgi:hypothetical protein
MKTILLINFIIFASSLLLAIIILKTQSRVFEKLWRLFVCLMGIVMGEMIFFSAYLLINFYQVSLLVFAAMFIFALTFDFREWLEKRAAA